MVQDKPLVSIGMPVYNGERFIREALDSLLAQDYENFELIISDNASTDSTWGICLEYAARDARLRLYRNEKNLGAVWNGNRLRQLSSGEYFMLASDHDLWHSTFITRCVEVLEDDPQIVLCHAQTEVIDADGRALEIVSVRNDTRLLTPAERFSKTVWTLANTWEWGHAIYGLIRSSGLRQVRFDRNVWAPDYLILAELSLSGSFAHIPEPLYQSRLNRKPGNVELYFERLDPANKEKRFKPTFLRTGIEYLLIVSRSRLGNMQKAKLMVDVVHCFCEKYEHRIETDLVNFARFALGDGILGTGLSKLLLTIWRAFRRLSRFLRR